MPALAIDKMSEVFSGAELFGISSPVREARALTAANIAKGRGRAEAGDLRHVQNTDAGSAVGLTKFLLLTRDFGPISGESPLALQDPVEGKNIPLEAPRS